MSKIYKYFSHEVMDLVFQRDGYCAVKCSFPKNYNDPYELFLGVDLNTSAECLASYKEIVDEIPQYPTTCFSKTPIASPMWAHYAKEHTGFVVEFDRDKLVECFKNCRLEDVNYKNEPDKRLDHLLAQVAVIKKPRYAYFLLQAAFSEAYFSKYTDWSYEQEVRLIDLEKRSEDIDGNKILFIPSSCITALIIGSKFPADKRDISIKTTADHNVGWYELQIGKSFPVPFMKDELDNVFTFKNGDIVESEYTCFTCSEPMFEDRDFCPWCGITEAHKLEAAMSNPFRMLDHYGQLEQYLENISKIGKKS